MKNLHRDSTASTLRAACACLLACVCIVVAMPGARATQSAKDQRQTRVSPHPPAIIIGPAAFSHGDRFAQGCWVRLYDKAQFKGAVLALAGPVEIAKDRLGSDFEWGHKYDSIVVGPAAMLTIYDAEDFKQRTATFKPGRRIENVNATLGTFENIRSLRIACSQ